MVWRTALKKQIDKNLIISGKLVPTAEIGDEVVGGR